MENASLVVQIITTILKMIRFAYYVMRLAGLVKMALRLVALSVMMDLC